MLTSSEIQQVHCHLAPDPEHICLAQVWDLSRVRVAKGLQSDSEHVQQTMISAVPVLAL